MTLTHAQVGSLKDAMRAMAAERDAGPSAAVAQLEVQLFAARSQIADLQAAAQQVCSFEDVGFDCRVTTLVSSQSRQGKRCCAALLSTSLLVVPAPLWQCTECHTVDKLLPPP